MAIAIKTIPTLYGAETREFRDRADDVEHRYIDNPRCDLLSDLYYSHKV